MRSQLSNSRGQSLIQVLIGVAIMGVIATGIASMQATQARESSALAEKISALDLARIVTATETDGQACTALFAPGNVISPASLVFDATSVSQSAPFVVTVRSVPGVGTSPAVVTENSLVSPMSSSLFVPANNIQVRVTSAHSGDLVISFDRNRLKRSIHDVSVRLNLTSTGPMNSRTLTGCNGAGPTGLTSFKVSDFGSLSKNVIMNTPMYRAEEYTVPVTVQPYDRHIAMHATGIWNVQSCGAATCHATVLVNAIVGGAQVPCGANNTTGASGPYTNVLMSNVSCIVKVPANTSASVKILFDARGGAFVNFNPGTYNTGYASASTPVFTLYSLPR